MILKPFFFQLYYFLPFLSLSVCVQLRVGFSFCYLLLAKVNLTCRSYESQRITMRMLNIPKLSKLNRTLIANSSWVQTQILSFTDPETQFIQCWQNSQVLGDFFTLTTLAKDPHKPRSHLLIYSWITFRNLRSWHPVPSLHSKQMGKQQKQWLTLFFWGPKSLQMVIAAMKLKDAYSLEGKL